MATSTVTVGCKHPNGLILRLFEMQEQNEPVMGGGTRTAKIAVQKGEPVRIRGNVVPFGTPAIHVVGGYALTHNVDAEFFAEWMKQNADTDLVKNKLIFAHASSDYVQKSAGEKTAVRSGLEPLDPEKPMRGIKKATEAV